MGMKQKKFMAVLPQIAEVVRSGTLRAEATDKGLVKITSSSGDKYFLSHDEATTLSVHINNAAREAFKITFREVRPKAKVKHHPEMEAALKAPKRR